VNRCTKSLSLVVGVGGATVATLTAAPEAGMTTSAMMTINEIMRSTIIERLDMVSLRIHDMRSQARGNNHSLYDEDYALLDVF
jgi:hypothetical protein